MARPFIGITSHLEPARWGDWVREAVVSPVTYTRAVERSGGIPVVLPPIPVESAARLVAGLDGVLISGGADVDPRLYGAHRHEQTGEPDHRRDRFELAVVRAAIDAGIPFLAISRGLHVLNVAMGGTLIQHLPDAVGHDRHAPDPVKMLPHDIQLSATSQLGRLLGAEARVRTLHHQAILRLGSGLVAVAWADDQIVEAVELQGHPFGIGVQWHPEEGQDLRIFEAFTAAATAGQAGGEADGQAAGEAGASNGHAAEAASADNGTSAGNGVSADNGTAGGVAPSAKGAPSAREAPSGPPGKGAPSAKGAAPGKGAAAAKAPSGKAVPAGTAVASGDAVVPAGDATTASGS